MGKLLDSIKKEIVTRPLFYTLLSIVILSALFVRVYRLGDLLRFYFDQGRDAKVIWRLWHEGKLFLIGPVTGLAGIYLGPFYYYLIAPFYLIGGGSPVYPAVFLSFLSTLAIIVAYYLGKEFHSRTAGFFAAFISSFSYYLIIERSRWLSNPTPMLIMSVLLLLSLWKIVKGESKKWWIAASFFAGFSLHFEAASAIFYIPVLIAFALWQRDKLPGLKDALLSFFAFFVNLVPQVAFNFRHDNILLDNFTKVFLQEKSFTLPLWSAIESRVEYFWGVFTTMVLPGWPFYLGVFAFLSFAALFAEKKIAVTKEAIKLLVIFIGVPLVGYVLYQGNLGNLYQYYMIGYLFPMFLLFSIGLALIWQHWFGKIAIVIFLLLFSIRNGVLTKNYLAAGIDGPEHIALGNELQAIDWVYEDARNKKEDFNVDVYVPPVIPHAYDYLFRWQGTKRCGEDLCGLKLEERVHLLYTLYEVDSQNPDRLEAWLERQKGIGEIVEEKSFGGITVQRRQRLKDE